MTKKFSLLSLVVLLLISGCASTNSEVAEEQWTQNFVTVKYRVDPVDIAAPYFEPLGRSDSSVVNGAWFDSGNQYLVISLQGTVYHYCGIGSSIWNSLKSADSMGSYFGDYIKGNFDCRIFPVPVYP
jgi:hypothetical protein